MCCGPQLSADDRAVVTTPTATAMASLTLDHLSNGRFILGLGRGAIVMAAQRPREPVREVTDGAALDPGVVHIAPGDLHLTVERSQRGVVPGVARRTCSPPDCDARPESPSTAARVTADSSTVGSRTEPRSAALPSLVCGTCSARGLTSPTRSPAATPRPGS